jgi:amidase
MTHEDEALLLEATIDDLQQAMADGRLSARKLVELYLARVEALNNAGPCLRAIIETNPDALAIADALDVERQTSGPRGPLHGIPVLLKDNIDTADQMQTTAGSLALLGSRPTRDATVARQLREAGAIVFGKANMSEWANFRSARSSSGWSARGGQAKNPYVLQYNPCGSSSGSATAVAANLVAVAIGTETDGSIVCPAHANGIVGLKPTVGLTSRAGVVPISHSQDTVGPMTRTVRDAAIVLGSMTAADPRDSATIGRRRMVYRDYTQFLDPEGLRGARIGVPRNVYFGYSADADALVERAIAIMRERGAEVVDPADIPTADLLKDDQSELTVLLYEFKHDLAAYLRERAPDQGLPDRPLMQTLADVIAFNITHAEQEMPFFGQDLFERAEEQGSLADETYLQALARSRRLGGRDGVDAVLDAFHLDALVAPTGGPAWQTDHLQGNRHVGGSSSPAAMAGYPLINVPVGMVGDLPVGITFMGRAYCEPVLLRLAYALEQTLQARRPPTFKEASRP